MLQPVSTTTLKGKNGSITVVFGEANPEQRVQCFKLAAAAFGLPLSEEDYIKREEYLGKRPLTRNNGWRIWALSLANDPNKVLATCKTMHRDILVRDVDGIRKQQAYCISSVVTDTQYRGHGLASQLLKHVAEWLDGPGNAVASMLYTIVGDFYVSRGWKMFSASQSTLSWPLGHDPSKDSSASSRTRLLTSEDIPDLCARDIEGIQTNFENRLVGPDEIHMAILPTANIIGWQHDRAGFIGLKARGKSPQTRGSICESADTWMYWYHDFRARELMIQRARVPAEQTKIHEEALASLLLDALEEAHKWDLPEVVLWDPAPYLLRAMELLSDKFRVDVKVEERIGKNNPSVRWRGSDQTKKITADMNEFYAWS